MDRWETWCFSLVLRSNNFLPPAFSSIPKYSLAIFSRSSRGIRSRLDFTLFSKPFYIKTEIMVAYTIQSKKAKPFTLNSSALGRRNKNTCFSLTIIIGKLALPHAQ